MAKRENKKEVRTVDIAVTVAHREVLLIERTKEPFLDKLVFPGGHVEETDESLAHAAAREALEEINLRVSPEALTFLTVLDRPGADPRPGHRVSHVFTIDFPSREALAGCHAASDAKKIHFRELASIKPEEIGFDHMDAISLLR